MVERHIQTAKSVLTKVFKSGEDPFLAILEYNITPKENLPAPSKILKGRKLRSILTTSRDINKPKYDIETIRKYLKEHQENQIKYNKSATKHKSLTKNQNVVIQEDKRKWKQGIIQEVNDFDSYKVKTEEGQTFRRNRSHLRLVEGAENEEEESDENKKTPLEIQEAANSPSAKETTSPSRNEDKETHLESAQPTWIRSRQIKKPNKQNL